MLAPLIAALQKAGHEIGGVFLPGNSELFRADVVRSHVQPSLECSPSELIASLREYRYEYALVATEKSLGYDIARRAGIPKRFGFWNGFSKPLKSFWLLTQLQRRYLRPLDDEDLHEVESLFRLGGGLIAELEPTRDVTRLRNLFIRHPAKTLPTVLIQITKKWQAFAPYETIVAAVIAAKQSLAARGMHTQIMGIQVESNYVQQLAKSSDLPARLFTDTRSWIEAIAEASAIISPDTGAAHIAGMLGIPTVDIFPPLSSTAQRARWIPWAAKSSIIHVKNYGDFSSQKLCEALARLF